MHENDIAHRDIKPENICFVEYDRHILEVKVVDWGLAEHFQSREGGRMFAEAGSCHYAAPEVLEVAFGMRSCGHSCACDWWRFTLPTATLRARLAKFNVAVDSSVLYSALPMFANMRI